MDTTISIAFLDRKDEDITISLNKNSLLYGLNGQGKTRVLKTIDLLVSFSKKSDVLDSFKLLKDLNLKFLTINGIPYEELFSVKNSIEDLQDKNFNKWLVDHEDELTLYMDYLDMLYSRIMNLDDFSNRVKQRFAVLIRRLKQCISKETKTIHTVDDLSVRIKELNDLIEMIAQEERLSNYSKESMMLQSFSDNEYRDIYYLGEKILRSIRMSTSFGSKKLMKRFADEKNKVKLALSSITTSYVTTENLTITEIEQYIKNKIASEKNKYFENMWNGKRGSIEKITIFKVKVRKLNRLLSNYMNVNIDVDFNGNMLFKKSDEEIEFFKLSSGEKRLIILFSSIIFYEANLFLIDEPELSLSLNFQNRLVNDMNRMIENNNMIVATHAPFIFKDFKLLENCEIVNV